MDLVCILRPTRNVWANRMFLENLVMIIVDLLSSSSLIKWGSLELEMKRWNLVETGRISTDSRCVVVPFEYRGGNSKTQEFESGDTRLECHNADSSTIVVARVPSPNIVSELIIQWVQRPECFTIDSKLSCHWSCCVVVTERSEVQPLCYICRVLRFRGAGSM